MELEAPVDVSEGFFGRHDAWLGLHELNYLHEEVRLCQAEQCVDQRIVGLVKLRPLLHNTIHYLDQYLTSRSLEGSAL
jgi:hypothetical protein